jgi:predicted nucleic acid-binding protein
VWIKLPEMLKLVTSVTIELMEQLNLMEIVSFDPDFDRIGGITRSES